jgi:hypothetical protein
MTIKELKEQIKNIPDHFEIVMEMADGGVCDIQIEHITESCDDPTPVGVIITVKETSH